MAKEKDGAESSPPTNRRATKIFAPLSIATAVIYYFSNPKPQNYYFARVEYHGEPARWPADDIAAIKPIRGP